MIDGAVNCTYDIFSVPATDFRLIFPGKHQDVEFIEDFVRRDRKAARRILASYVVFSRRQEDDRGYPRNPLLPALDQEAVLPDETRRRI